MVEKLRSTEEIIEKYLDIKTQYDEAVLTGDSKRIAFAKKLLDGFTNAKWECKEWLMPKLVLSADRKTIIASDEMENTITS